MGYWPSSKSAGLYLLIYKLTNDTPYSWGLDNWYPVTFVSRPLPEMLFYLVLFGIQIGERIVPPGTCKGLNWHPVVATVIEQSLYVGPSIQWLADTHRLAPPDREELKVEARASSVFMSIQALIGTRAYLSKLLFSDLLFSSSRLWCRSISRRVSYTARPS